MAWDDTRRIERKDGKKVVMNTNKIANDLYDVAHYLSKRDFVDLQEALIDRLSDVRYPKKKAIVKVPKKIIKKKKKKVLVKKRVL